MMRLCVLLLCSPDSAKKVHSQLCAVIRPMYSSPPIHGAAIVVAVLSGATIDFFEVTAAWGQGLNLKNVHEVEARVTNNLVDDTREEAWYAPLDCAAMRCTQLLAPLGMHIRPTAAGWLLRNIICSCLVNQYVPDCQDLG